MTDKLKQTIKEEIEQLPNEEQDAIGAIDWVKIAENIGTENNLKKEEIDDFQLETLLALIGATDLKFYIINIENHVETTTDLAKKIAEEAKQKIFTPIYNILTENIKRDLKNKNVTWQQNINFILSNGNYSSFISEREDSSTGAPIKKIQVSMPTPLNTPPTLAEIKANLEKQKLQTKEQ